MGVDIFFVLSGYLITTLLVQEIADTDSVSLKRFYIRRLLRLGPAITALYLFEIFRSIYNFHDHSEILKATAISAANLMNWNRAYDLFPTDVLGHTWSLSMEEQFYLIWPTALLFIYRRRPVVWLSLTIVSILLWRCGLVALGRPNIRTYNGFDTHSDGLFLGCLLAFCMDLDWVKKAAKIASIPVIVAMSFAFFLLPHDATITQTIGLSIVAIASAILLIVSIENVWARRFLSNPVFVFTGKISYGWYLWHYPLIMLASTHINRSSLGGSIVYGAAIPLSYLIAVGSYFYIEQPALRLKKKYAKSPVPIRG
jgi:peptidoglycan/LPS O-acetylase OafA/YrhL